MFYKHLLFVTCFTAIHTEIKRSFFLHSFIALFRKDYSPLVRIKVQLLHTSNISILPLYLALKTIIWNCPSLDHKSGDWGESTHEVLLLVSHGRD